MDESSVYDMKSREDWLELLDEMGSLLDLPTALLDRKNFIVQSSGERNGLCREIRKLKEAKMAICGQSQQFMAKMARDRKSPVVEICEAGMGKLVVPLFHNQNYLGCITACGCRLPKTEIETHIIERTIGMGGLAINEIAEKVPVVQKERLERLAESFSFCVEA